MMISSKPRTTGLLATLTLLASFAMIDTAAAQTYYMTTEEGYDRLGGDYKNYPLPSPGAAQCSSACLSEPQCKAYTYVKPGIQGPQARCWLKNSFQMRTKQDVTVSGVKVYFGANAKHIAWGGQFQDTFHLNQDRNGSDYKHFTVPNADLGMCMDICVNATKCRAFTFVSPGIQGKDAFCWLKDSVPGPRSDHCCASGFKQ